MATSKEYLNFILDQLSALDEITYRSMMGEYIIYYHDKIVAYLCDDRLLVKITPCAESILPNAPHEPPYEGAKDMLVVENVDDRCFIESLFNATYPELPLPKRKNKKV